MKLSIIVPVYNTQEYLPKCVNSILAQTLTDFECILVDDGSTDNCPAICDEYAKKDPRIIVIHKENGGLSDARNAGLDIAKGDYIGFVDSDDWIEPEMYEFLYHSAVKNSADISTCKFHDVYSNGNVKNYWESNDSVTVYEKSYILENFFDVILDIAHSVCIKIYKHHIFDSIRFPLGRIYEDSLIYLETVDKCNRIAVSNKVCYNYFQRDGSILHSSYKYKQTDIILFYNNMMDFFLKKNIKNQYETAFDLYITQYMKHHFEIYLTRKQYKKQFKHYRKQAIKYISEVIKSPKICKLKTIAYISIFISPRISHKICIKYFPECLLTR